MTDIHALNAYRLAGIEEPEPQETGPAPAPHPGDVERLVTPIRVLRGRAFAELPPPTWLVEPYLTHRSFAVLTAPYSSGKTTLALGLAMAVATGRDWFGCAVTPGAVLYLVQEGRAGLSGRYARLCEELGENPDHVPIAFVIEPVSFLQATAAEALLAGMAEAGLATDLALIIVDTWHRTGPSADENDAGQTGARITSAERLAQLTGATLLVLHHPSKSGKSGRGSGALEDSADTVLRLERDADAPELVRLSVDKQRDAERAEPIAFDFVPGQLVRRDGGAHAAASRYDPVTRARPLLEALAGEELPASSLVALGKACGMAKSTVYELLGILTSRNLVKAPPRDPKRLGQSIPGGCYTLTPGGLELVRGALRAA